MKSKEFGAILRRFADLLRVTGASVTGDRMLQLATLFDISPTASVADVSKKVSAANLGADFCRPTGSELAAVLTQLVAFLSGQAKATLLADIVAVGRMLEQHGSVSISGLLEAAPAILIKPVTPKKVIAPVRNDLIDRYVRRLEETLGDEPGFVALFKEISESADIGKAEALAIAKRFTGKPGGSKPTAMKNIWSRHHNLMTFRAKSESRSGRSAA